MNGGNEENALSMYEESAKRLRSAHILAYCIEQGPRAFSDIKCLINLIMIPLEHIPWPKRTDNRMRCIELVA